MPITVNQVNLDWLSISDTNPESGKKVRYWIESLMGKGQWSPTKLSQYRGHMHSSGVRVMQARIKDTDWYLSMINGEYAHKAWQAGAPWGYRVSRIDIQCTVDAGRWMPSVQRQRLLKLWASNGNRARQVTAIEGSKGHTLYIGARTSDRFLRIYDKGKGLRRVEAELKGTAARAALVAAKEMPLGSILAQHIAHVPAGVLESVDKVRLLCERPDYYPTVKRPDADMASRVLWIRHTVVPAVRRALNDHGAYGEVAEIVRDLFIEAANMGAYSAEEPANMGD